MQGYDEYLVGYGENKRLIDASGLARMLPGQRGFYTHAVILDGQIAGRWKSVVKKDWVAVEVQLFAPADDPVGAEIASALERYAEFLGFRVQPTILAGTSSVSIRSYA